MSAGVPPAFLDVPYAVIRWLVRTAKASRINERLHRRRGDTPWNYWHEMPCTGNAPSASVFLRLENARVYAYELRPVP